MRFAFRGFKLDLERRELSAAGAVISLEPKVFAVLAHLLRHRDRAVPKTELFNVGWPEEFVSDAVLTRCIRLIRQAFGDDGNKQEVIKTLRGYGYRFSAPVDRLEESPALSPASPSPEPPVHALAVVTPTQVTSAPASGQRCAVCQMPNRSSRQFCGSCGHPLWQPCPHCGFANDPAECFCGGCGQSQMDLSAPEAPPFNTERRQLTVMGCDLVGAPLLSEHLDPEDLWEVIRAYQQLCADAIQRFGGHMARVLNDALLAYFGWPQAHEDDPQRAVRCGLAILDTIAGLNTRLKQERQVRLAVRIGIHTGPVVVGEMASSTIREPLAIGETPTIAAQLKGMVEPDKVVMSEVTARLVEGYFLCQSLGPLSLNLQGVAEPLGVYRLLKAHEAQRALDVAALRGLTPLSGRDAEIELVLDRWAQVQDGIGQVVIVSGEAGIGKSRLLQAVRERMANTPHLWLECQGSPYHQHSPLAPLIALLEQQIGLHQEDPPEVKLQKLETFITTYGLPLETTVPLWTNLLSMSVNDLYLPLPWTPQKQKQQTLETAAAWLFSEATRQPVVFALEDLHWIDPSTLEWLNLLVEQAPTARLLALWTCRPAFQPPWPLWSHLTSLTVSRLRRKHVEAMVSSIAGSKPLPAEVMRRIVIATDGVPLFVEEVTKTTLASGGLRAVNENDELSTPLPTLTIPTTLHDALMARLDHLHEAKVVAQMGAVLGRTFTAEVLQAVSHLDEAVLWRGLEQLVETELVYQRGAPPQATYTFKHALVQATAYQSLLKSTRQQYHAWIAKVLAERFPETTVTQPEVLAYHYTEAGIHEQAVACWYRAGQRAIERSAHVEAIRHLEKGLELLNLLPETRHRTQRELDFQFALGRAVMASQGFGAPESERIHLRARDLCQELGDTSRLFLALYGLWRVYATVCNKLDMAREIGEQLLSLAQRLKNPVMKVGSHAALSVTYTFLGELERARFHAEQSIELYDQHGCDPSQFSYEPDPKITCLVFLVQVLAQMGYPDQALQRIGQCQVLAREHDRILGRVYTLSYSMACHILRREIQKAQMFAEATIQLAQEHGIGQWLAIAQGYRGWTCAMQGQYVKEKTVIEQSIVTRVTTGGYVGRTRQLIQFAEICGIAGLPEAGLRALAEARTTAGQRNYDAELHRLRGELLLQLASDNQTEAERCFHQAITVARSKSAKTWELRAATSLARLWQSQNRSQEAYALLTSVYNWFTEGFDTADLRDAKSLLDVLAGSGEASMYR